MKKPTGPVTPPALNAPFAALAKLKDQLPAGVAAPLEKKLPRLFADKVVVRFTKKGHGGKTVTVVTGVMPAVAQAMCADMKRALGCGARVVDGAIVLQGELVERAVRFVEDKGAVKVVRGS